VEAAVIPALAGAVRPRILPRLMVAARDGVELCTDVYLPVGAEAIPTVVVRTPYGRNRPFLMHLGRRLSDRGFAVLMQDCRGRYASGGRYELGMEDADTHDTLAWMAGQEWSTGSAALLGVSVACLSNFRAAAAPPPDGVRVEAMVGLMGVLDAHSLFYRGGALVLHWALPWVTLMSPEHGGRSGWLQLPWPEIFRRRPLERLAGDTRGNDELWRRVVAWPVRAPGWDGISALEAVERIEVPTLLMSGWNDFLLGHTLRAHRSLTARGGGDHRLVVGDWNHQSLFYSFRAAQEGERTHLDLLSLVCDWLARRLLPGEGAGEEREPPVLCQVLGTGRWIGSERFPLAEARETAWHLASGGGARTAHGDGRLVAEASARGGHDTFVYDPEDPVPSVGGALWQFEPAGLLPGPADQSEVEERADVLVYTGEPLDEEMVVAGPVRLELWVASSVRDTDFTAKLVDVDPAGVPRIVQDGIQRARYREGPAREVPLEPQQPARITVDLDATAYRFAAGHRVRLEVSSSNFPRYDRHPNTAGQLHTATGSAVAHQTVFHGGATPSRLVLLVLDGAALERLAWEAGRG
jgi:uncharacterized protein